VLTGFTRYSESAGFEHSRDHFMAFASVLIADAGTTNSAGSLAWFHSIIPASYVSSTSQPPEFLPDGNAATCTGGRTVIPRARY